MRARLATDNECLVMARLEIDKECPVWTRLATDKQSTRACWLVHLSRTPCRARQIPSQTPCRARQSPSKEFASNVASKATSESSAQSTEQGKVKLVRRKDRLSHSRRRHQSSRWSKARAQAVSSEREKNSLHPTEHLRDRRCKIRLLTSSVRSSMWKRTR